MHHVVLERAAALTQHPQAHFINHRTMEVLRHVGGGLAAAVVRQGPPLDQWRRFVYCESMTGGVLGEVDHFQGARYCAGRCLLIDLCRRLLRFVTTLTGCSCTDYLGRTVLLGC